jgi:enterochelin esterase-like enzyme
VLSHRRIVTGPAWPARVIDHTADPAAFAGKVRLLWRGVGTAEPERMCEGIRKLRASLTAAGIAHVYQESEGTDHEWQTWRRNLNDFAARLFR